MGYPLAQPIRGRPARILAFQLYGMTAQEAQFSVFAVRLLAFFRRRPSLNTEGSKKPANPESFWVH